MKLHFFIWTRWNCTLQNHRSNFHQAHDDFRTKNEILRVQYHLVPMRNQCIFTKSLSIIVSAVSSGSLQNAWLQFHLVFFRIFACISPFFIQFIAYEVCIRHIHVQFGIEVTERKVRFLDFLNIIPADGQLVHIITFKCNLPFTIFEYSCT